MIKRYRGRGSQGGCGNSLPKNFMSPGVGEARYVAAVAMATEQ